MRRAEYLLSPLFIIPVLVLIANDHFLKEMWPGLITGKLSDLAGMCFFPVLMVAIVEASCFLIDKRIYATPYWFTTASMIVAVGFALVKLVQPLADAYAYSVGALRWVIVAPVNQLLGESTPPITKIVIINDPTDVLMIVGVLVGVWIGYRWRSPKPRQVDLANP